MTPHKFHTWVYMMGEVEIRSGSSGLSSNTVPIHTSTMQTQHLALGKPTYDVRAGGLL